jgi:hypothetical protein
LRIKEKYRMATLLPDEQQQDKITFIFAKSLSYKSRIFYTVTFILLGILLQLFASFWLGFILVVIGSALSWIKGYKPDAKTIPDSEKWSQVTPDEFSKILSKNEQMKKWDIDAFDITNSLGGCLFIGTGALFFITFFVIEGAIGSQVAWYFAFDAIAILAPHWFTGTREYLKKDQLIIKIQLLQKVMDALSKPSDVQVLPMLETNDVKTGSKTGQIPNDARLMLKFLNAPEYFLGVQVQISINNVQGTDYPYLYCVVLARTKNGLFTKKAKEVKSAQDNAVINLAFEKQKSDDVDVLVIRQFTTKTSGYYTNPSACFKIVETAVNLTRELIK